MTTFHLMVHNLLTSTEMTSMQIRKMHNLCIEIYKTLPNLNPHTDEGTF